jgi:hypothetical protein
MNLEARSQAWTLTAEPAAERQIRLDLERIGDALHAELGDNLRALLLVGGYARNEGSVVEREGVLGPYNDYDFVAVVRRVPRGLHAQLSEFGQRWSERVGVDVDVWPIQQGHLARVPPTLFWLDAVLGGVRTVLGDGSVAQSLPPHTPRRLPLEECARLLSNRAVGLALSNLEHSDRDMRRARHVHKAVLACGDVRLAAADRYRPTLGERQVELERLAGAPGIGADLVEAYRDAVAFRSRPDRWQPPGDPEAWYRASLERIQGWHLGYERWRVGSPEQPERFARWDGRIYPRLPDVTPVRALASAVRAAAAGATPWRPWVGHPRERLARAAVALAYGPEDRACWQAAGRLLGVHGERLDDPAVLHAQLSTLAAQGG